MAKKLDRSNLHVSGHFTEALVKALWETWLILLNRGVDVIRAFPNPWNMFNAFIELTTGILGELIVAPIRIVKLELIAAVKQKGQHNKLMTVEKAIDAVFESLVEMFQVGTLTQPNSGMQWLVATVGRFIYRAVKKTILLRVLLAAQTEKQFVAQLLLHYAKGARLLLWLVIIIVWFVMLPIYIAVLYVSFAISWNWWVWVDRMLFQDSKKVYVRHGRITQLPGIIPPRQHRINRVNPGSDEP